MRTKQVRVVLSDTEAEAVQRVADRLGFDSPAQALRVLVLAVDGDQKALARVVPFLAEFRRWLEEK